MKLKKLVKLNLQYSESKVCSQAILFPAIPTLSLKISKPYILTWSTTVKEDPFMILRQIPDH